MKISDYCPWCDFNTDEPLDCLCEELCGEVGCQGLPSDELESYLEDDEDNGDEVS